MNLFVITEDPEIISIVNNMKLPESWVLKIINTQIDELELLEQFHTFKPQVLLIDDDIYTPRTYPILKILRKLYDSLIIIFITLDSSIELGRNISQLKIHNYMIKPISSEFLSQSILSTEKLLTKKIHNH
ncbi:MAG: hypothetical protein L3J41_04410 [Melioribacteraceae bacterium]|nr:hypothetical protein [Melioribacteraceae bacterium]